jgi:hypothetical protein
MELRRLQVARPADQHATMVEVAADLLAHRPGVDHPRLRVRVAVEIVKTLLPSSPVIGRPQRREPAGAVQSALDLMAFDGGFEVPQAGRGIAQNRLPPPRRGRLRSIAAARDLADIDAAGDLAAVARAGAPA